MPFRVGPGASLARFQAPEPGEPSTLDAFSRRFAGRINEPFDAYEAQNGTARDRHASEGSPAWLPRLPPAGVICAAM